jgi:hypothetical protein
VEIEKIERSVVMKFTFPASMSVDEQDVILERIKILPYEQEISVPPRPAPDPDDMARDQRRVVGYDEPGWIRNSMKHPDCVMVKILYPGWMPKEIVAQADKKIPSAAALIVNEYLSRRFVGTEE